MWANKMETNVVTSTVKLVNSWSGVNVRLDIKLLKTWYDLPVCVQHYLKLSQQLISCFLAFS